MVIMHYGNVSLRGLKEKQQQLLSARQLNSSRTLLWLFIKATLSLLGKISQDLGRSLLARTGELRSRHHFHLDSPFGLWYRALSCGVTAAIKERPYKFDLRI